MNLTKAIKNLKAGRKDCGMIPPEEFTPTLDLAIEALKLIDWIRQGGIPASSFILPGETEDDSDPFAGARQPRP